MDLVMQSQIPWYEFLFFPVLVPERSSSVWEQNLMRLASPKNNALNVFHGNFL